MWTVLPGGTSSLLIFSLHFDDGFGRLAGCVLLLAALAVLETMADEKQQEFGFCAFEVYGKCCF